MSHTFLSRFLSNTRKLGFLIASIMMVSLWAPSLLARDKPAPVIDATEGAGGSVDARLTRIERQNQTLVDLITRMENLQNEVQRMLGELEEQTHNIESLKKRQRDLYLDTDQRLRKLEESKTTSTSAPSMGAFVPTPSTPSTSVMPQPTPAAPVSDDRILPGAMPPGTVTGMPVQSSPEVVDPQAERVAYERAFNFLKDGRYDLAVTDFKKFVVAYPKGSYADNAQYWLGEANYVQRNFKDALAEFEKVVSNYPGSPKRADAMLKMGYTYQELGDIEKARQSLNDVIASYPASTAASLAKKRIQDLKRL